ncbi:MAG: FtsQ-type POTRA domain-containing protein [Defluviitaleaceae bacterium]|nr:FtsQ-type POTRA domain-containing protein [Defluviitaleaceae bacterium]
MRSLKFKIVLGLGAIAFGLALFLASPYFNIREIEIAGNYNVSQAEILAKLDFGNNTNILFANLSAARRRVLENFHIGYVSIQRDIPGRLYVTVQERRVVAYIEHVPGSFLSIDDQGRVIEVRSYFTEPLPVLEGVQFNRFVLGELLDVPETYSFRTVVLYAQLLNQYDLIHRVSHMIVSDPYNVRIMIGNIEFNVGDAAGADEKIRTVVAILDSLPNAEDMRGFAYIGHNQNEHFFVILQ